MKIIVLGSGGYYTNEDAHTACYAIPDLGIIFDCGNGFFRAPQYLKTETVHIFLSHGHLDHIEGVRMVSHLLKNQIYKKIIIYALPEVCKGILTLQNQPFSGSASPKLDMIEVSPNEKIKLHNGAEILTFPLFHTSHVLGFKLCYEGKIVSYVTDTRSTETETYTDYIENSDVLLQECYFPNSCIQRAIKGGHSVPSMITTICKKANIKNVYIIHHCPTGGKEEIIEEIQKEIPNAKLAKDLQEIDF